MIRFTVQGVTQAAARARSTIMRGHIVAYDPQKNRDFKKLVQLAALKHRPKELLSEALRLQVDVMLPIPKRFTRLQRQKALDGRLRPAKKPDCSNLVKSIEDALNGLIWTDDSIIVSLLVRKWYSDSPRAIVVVTAAEGEGLPCHTPDSI